MNLELDDNKTVSSIISEVCERYSIDRDDFLSRQRPNRIAHPRMMAMYIARQNTNLPLIDIGMLFGGRDHGTVIHACKKITEAIEAGPNIKEIIAEILQSIENSNKSNQ